MERQIEREIEREIERGREREYIYMDTDRQIER
jgi:hypothetical protein